MTTGNMTIARPYALAAFEYASEENEIHSWENMLQAAACIAKNKTVINLFDNPQMTKEQLAELFCEVLDTLLDTGKKNFIRLLAEYKRLAFLPDIFACFKLYRESQEQIIGVRLTSAVPLDKKYQEKFINALTKRLRKKISVEWQEDSTLLGGALIQIGDSVIDGSVRGKLNRLLETL